MMLWWKGTSVFFFSPSNEVLDYWAGGSNYMYSGPQLLHCLLFLNWHHLSCNWFFLLGEVKIRTRRIFTFAFFSMVVLFLQIQMIQFISLSVNLQ